MIVAVLGLGEAGAALAADLVAAGVTVHGWDPAPKALPPIPLAANAQVAVQEADVILSVNSAKVALTVATEVAPCLRQGQLFADMNTAAPALKVALAAVIAPTGAHFVDLALMAPVPGNGLRTPSLTSGAGAAAFVRLFQPLGMPVSVVDEQPGSAATRKLLRSVFMKGLAMAVVESLAAAAACGNEAWLRDDIANTLTTANAALLDRLILGSQQHALRRAEEMRAAADLLQSLAVPPHISLAAVAWFDALIQQKSLPVTAKADTI